MTRGRTSHSARPRELPPLPAAPRGCVLTTVRPEKGARTERRCQGTRNPKAPLWPPFLVLQHPQERSDSAGSLPGRNTGEQAAGSPPPVDGDRSLPAGCVHPVPLRGVGRGGRTHTAGAPRERARRGPHGSSAKTSPSRGSVGKLGVKLGKTGERRAVPKAFIRPSCPESHSQRERELQAGEEACSCRPEPSRSLGSGDKGAAGGIDLSERLREGFPTPPSPLPFRYLVSVCPAGKWHRRQLVSGFCHVRLARNPRDSSVPPILSQSPWAESQGSLSHLGTTAKSLPSKTHLPSTLLAQSPVKGCKACRMQWERTPRRP